MSFKLGRFSDIPIIIHWSFSILFMGIVIAVGFLRGVNTAVVYGLGIVALFTSVIIHEFFHAYAASIFGHPTEEIVLYPLGGMSKIKEMPTEPKQEFLIAFAGPLTNFIIAGLVWGLSFLLQPIDFVFFGRSFVGLVELYALLNLTLGLFNLLVPAIPMDGGRLLRSFLNMKMEFPKATKIAVQVSRGVAILMGIIGLFANIWLLFIAFFIYIAGSSELEESMMRYMLEDLPVSKVMNKNVETVSKNLTIEELLDKMIQTGNVGYLVGNKNKYDGYVSLTDVKKVPLEQRNNLTIADIMTKELLTIPINATAKEALQILRSEEISRVYVLETDGSILGKVTHQTIIKYVEISSVQNTTTNQIQPSMDIPPS